METTRALELAQSQGLIAVEMLTRPQTDWQRKVSKLGQCRYIEHYARLAAHYAHVALDDNGYEQAKTDARAIAAVPDLIEALQLADGIITQHNLLSTASEQDRCDTLNRLFDWFNGPRLAALRKAGVL